jgi:anti-sigma regulatory factor (Ser/Thr protein kinase)
VIMSGGTNEGQRSLDACSGSFHLQLLRRLPTVQELELLMSRDGQQSPRRHMTSIWAMQSRLELWALPRTVPYARRHARQVLAEWGLDKLSETVELLVSEIITNAVHASTGPAGSRHGEVTASGASTLLFWLAADGERALIQVWDCCEAKPQRRESATSAENGRGLLLVEALSDGWGLYVPTGWAGKVVWALVAGE